MTEEIYNEEYAEYQLQRSSFRRFIRRHFYFANMLRFVKGPTIDFGCGIGEFLEELPAGSLGFEVNKVAVDYCVKRGLNVLYYDYMADDYRFDELKPGVFGTIVVAHVFEHLHDSHLIIKKLITSAKRIGIERVIIVVPGVKGFQHDRTHQTFIDPIYFQANNLKEVNGYRVIHQRYFPVNSKWFSQYFTHNEMVTVYQRQ